jgi:hypothetical protein
VHKYKWPKRDSGPSIYVHGLLDFEVALSRVDSIIGMTKMMDSDDGRR